jgi:hypothetical protein
MIWGPSDWTRLLSWKKSNEIMESFGNYPMLGSMIHHCGLPAGSARSSEDAAVSFLLDRTQF